MRFSRARYITLCQQSLVTAAVLAVGVSAAGVRTLDIVPAPGTSSGTGQDVADRAPHVPLDTAREQPRPTKVDVAPVTPKVREVRVPAVPERTRATAEKRAARPSERAVDTQVSGQRLAAVSTPQKVRGYATVGATWKAGTEYAEDQIDVQVRTEKAGRWSGWMPAEYHDDHGPDSGSAEARSAGERPGTDALVIGDVDQVQLRALTTDGQAPPDLRLAVVDPGVGKMATQKPEIDTATLPEPGARGDGAESSGPITVQTDDGEDSISLSAMKRAPKPYIYSRKQWGANERLRDRSEPDYGTVKAGFIHHTVNANNYDPEDVPYLLRGIYAYHTQSRGWRDIGYNYLVDRFGRIWEGRYGGVNRAVVGAHTLGYNEYAFAMSAIGNFDIANPPAKVSAAYARLFAWKLSMYNIRADARKLWVKNRYLPAINGHRDVGSTACPGRYLYARLPSIRVAAQRLQNAAQSGTPTTPTKPTVPSPLASAKMSSPGQTPFTWSQQPSSVVFPRGRNLAGSSHPDLVLQRSDGGIRVLPTGGQAGFGSPVSTSVSWANTDLVAAVGDVTGDGRGDVVVRSARDRRSVVFAGNGNGGVSKPGIRSTSVFQYATWIGAAGDWNRDRHADVLVTTNANRLWMVPGLGAGRFGTPRLVADSWSAFTSTAVAGDLTGDGRLDLVALHRNGYLYVVPGTANGRVGTPAKRRAAGGSFDSVLGGAGDMTGDTRADVAVRSSKTGRVAILPGLGAGRFGSALGWFNAARGLGRVSVAQVAGSGQLDLVGVNSSRTALVVLPHNGLANLRAVLPGNLSVPGATQVLAVGDWNRDGKGDVITRERSGDVLVLRPGLGNGSFSAGRTLAAGWSSVAYLAAVGDVTGDAFPDLVGRLATGAMRVFPGNGAAGFLTPRTVPARLRTFQQIGAGSWTASRWPGAMFVSSDRSFVPYVGTDGGDPKIYDWVLGAGDLDGDGRADLVTRTSNGLLWLRPGTTTGLGERRLIGSGFRGYRLAG